VYLSAELFDTVRVGILVVVFSDLFKTGTEVYLFELLTTLPPLKFPVPRLLVFGAQILPPF
jgi:hypothetical protein